MADEDKFTVGELKQFKQDYEKAMLKMERHILELKADKDALYRKIAELESKITSGINYGNWQ